MEDHYPRMNNNPGPSKLFALVIGINKYPARPLDKQLHGAVGDAQRIVHLLEDLGVPAGNIRKLYDEEATHAKIIEGIQHLSKRRDIEKNVNTIFIYYAGHGSSMERADVIAQSVPGFWDDWDEDQIELLCPHDMGLEKDGRLVYGIADKMIACYLNELAKEKGDNIVLMLDCCHSASITRRDKDYSPRFFADPPTFDPSDTEFWSNIPLPAATDALVSMHEEVVRGGAIAEGFRAMYNRSHILLAACSRSQQAKELSGRLPDRPPGGLFTFAFLDAIKVQDNWHGLSYKMLFKLLSMQSDSEAQHTPHCDGYNVGRELFSLEMAEQAEQRVQVLAETSALVMKAGSAHGVRLGSHVHLFMDNLSDSNCLQTADVTNVDPFQSELKLRDGTVEQGFRCYAHFKASAPLLIFPRIDQALPSGMFGNIHEAIPQEETHLIVSSEEESHLVLTWTKNGILVQFNSAHATPHSESHGMFNCGQIKRSEDDSEFRHRLGDVFKWAGHFIYHVTHIPPYQPRVSVELFRLEKVTSLNSDEQYKPVGPNLIDPTNCAVIQCGAGRSNRLYGMTLRNNDSTPYYPYLVSFDCDLSSTVLYSPPMGIKDGDHLDGKLACGSSLNWGFGGTTLPVNFRLSDEANEEISIWKLILMTKNTDVSCLEQRSIFEELRVDDDPAAIDEVVDRWSSISVTIIQKK